MANAIKLSPKLAYQDKVETVTEMKTSLFSEVYKKATNNIIEVLESGEAFFYKEKQKHRMDNYSNNLVAFVGDRGTGKSSAMKSFINALIKGELNEFDEKFNINKQFMSLSVIDPSQLKYEEGILESVIANMYTDIKQIIERKDNRYSCNEVPVDEMQDILSQFDKTYISLKCYRSEARKSYDDENDTALEKLDRLSSSQKLRDDFQELAKKYLKMRADYSVNSACSKEKTDSKSQLLVIAIDDLDMNIENGFELAVLGGTCSRAVIYCRSA